MEGFTGNLFDLLEDSIMEEVSFTEPEPYPVVEKLYSALVADYVPAFAARPLRVAIGGLSRLVSWIKKRKIRRWA
jgi:hypothetical protein